MIPSMAQDHAGRLARAGEAAGAAGLDALIVAPGPDLAYLAGYDPPPLERLTALVVRPDGAPVLLVPELERPLAAASPAGSLLAIVPWRDGADPYAALGRLLGPHAARGRFGAADRMWASHLMALQARLPEAAFTAASRVLGALRAVKDAAEVELLRSAAAAADRTFDAIRAERFAGRAEREVAAALSAHLVAFGHETVSFVIVGSGPNGASPHHEAGDRVIEPGDAVVLDFGGRLSGYASDITRTVAVGESAPQVREVHAVVRAAQRAAFEAVRPGVAAEDVDRAARGVIEEAGYGRQFFHRTGHGIGLEEHEPPWIVQGNGEPLRPGMAFSIEPGVYLEGRFGVRIEDIVVVTDDGVRSLNEAPRDLTVVA